MLAGMAFCYPAWAAEVAGMIKTSIFDAGAGKGEPAAAAGHRKAMHDSVMSPFGMIHWSLWSHLFILWQRNKI